jgi:hypothetical protein
MNPRERTIAIALLAAILLVAGGFLFQRLYLVPLQEREDEVRAARDALESQRKLLLQSTSNQAKLLEWRKMSLPGGDNIARQREYRQLLDSFITSSGFMPGDLDIRASDPPPKYTGQGGNEIYYTPLNFTVTGRAELSRLVRLLRQFYSQPLLHKIKSLQIKRPTGATPKATGELEIDLKVEAIIVKGAKNRSTLLPDEKEKVLPHVLAEPTRDYTALANKNIFYAPVPPPKQVEGPDPAASVKLVNITRNADGQHTVVLHDETAKPPVTWWLYPEKNKDIFEIRNKNRDLRVQGIIVRVNFNDREVIFRSGERYYRIKGEQTVELALRRPLTPAEITALKLPPADAHTKR